MKINSYKDLIVRQRAVDLSVKIYKVTKKFPKEELYGLTSQMRRASVSIPSNIAEGRNRGTRNDFAQYLRIALGSGAELETQLEISRRLDFVDTIDTQKIASSLEEIMKMLNAIINKLKADS